MSQPSNTFRTPQWLNEQRTPTCNQPFGCWAATGSLMMDPRKKGRSSASRNFTDSGTILDDISRSTTDHAWPVGGSSARTNGRKMKMV